MGAELSQNSQDNKVNALSWFLIKGTSLLRELWGYPGAGQPG